MLTASLKKFCNMNILVNLNQIDKANLDINVKSFVCFLINTHITNQFFKSLVDVLNVGNFFGV